METAWWTLACAAVLGLGLGIGVVVGAVVARMVRHSVYDDHDEPGHR